MAYKYATGSIRRGDIYDEDDAQGNTYIDWTPSGDAVGIVAGGTTVFVASGSTALVGVGTAAPDYTLDVAGTVGVDEYIYHNGDADTYIRFQDDKISLFAGNKNMLKLEEATNDKVLVNAAGVDIDFRVNGENVNDLFTTDAANDLITIGGNIHTSVHDYGTTADINVDFNEDSLQKAVLNGNVAIDTPAANKGAGKSIMIEISGDNSARNITWNSDWGFIGEKPSSLAANKVAMLSMTCFGVQDLHIRCSYAVQD